MQDVLDGKDIRVLDGALVSKGIKRYSLSIRLTNLNLSHHQFDPRPTCLKSVLSNTLHSRTFKEHPIKDGRNQEIFFPGEAPSAYCHW